MSTITNHPDHGYDEMVAVIRHSFARAAGNPIFTTDASGLFDAFLNGLPPEHRQHYKCRACERFFNNYGGLIWLNENGHPRTVMLPEGLGWSVPDFFVHAAAEMEYLILNAKITGVFLHRGDMLGEPATADSKRGVTWTHFHAPNPAPFSSPVHSAEQRMAELRQEHGMICAGLLKYRAPVVEQALALLVTGQLYRGERVLPTAQWLHELHAQVAGMARATRDNLIWRAAALAPTGFAHFSTGALSVLLDCLKAGTLFENLKEQWQRVMATENYMRAKAAPAAGNIQHAEKLAQALGFELSLQRR